jgi:hypothetical protein
MHTSTRLISSNFEFYHHASGRVHQADFATFCPDYHELDRVGVVSLGLEDGVLQTSYALLALTTAFYDQLRARYGGDTFFDYPQHFAFVGAEGASVHAGGGLLPLDMPQLWDAWSWLDVWPTAKWVTAPITASGMLQRVFDYQINRIFWPRALKPELHETQLPGYIWKMLKTSLKSVYFYEDSEPTTNGVAGEQLEIRVAPAIEEVVQESIARLPAAVQRTHAKSPYSAQFYERVSIDDFLRAMQSVPVSEPTVMAEM